MNVHKAQKHMQRATELINQEGPLAFGTGDDEPGVLTRGKRRQIDDLEQRKKEGHAKRTKRTRRKKCIKNEFSIQIQGVCYMYAAYNLLLRRLLKDPALNSLESVTRAKKQLESGSVLRVGRHTLEPKAVFLYDDLHIYWSLKRLWDITPNRSDHKEPKLLLSANMPAYERVSTADLCKGGSAGLVLQAIVLATEKHNEIAVVREYNKVFLQNQERLHTFTTVQCENGNASAKNEKIKSNSVKTLKGIFENTYYDDKYIFFEVVQFSGWGYEEVLEVYDIFPGKDRFAGAFISIYYAYGPNELSHEVCMIPECTIPGGEMFMVYDGNHTSGNVYYDNVNDLRNDPFFDKIQEITYVYSPKFY